MYAERSREIMRGWADRVPKSEWLAAHENLSKALWLDEGHGVYQYRMARLYHLCFLSYVDCDVDKRQAAEKARGHYTYSIQIRPRWPRTIAEFAQLKRDLGEYDEEFLRSLRLAMLYGPWEPDVHTIVARVALSRWSLFDADMQALLAEHIVRGLRSPSRGAGARVYKIVVQFSHAATGELTQALAALLIEHDWHGKEGDYSDMAFLFWAAWSGRDRLGIVQKMAAVSASNSARRLILSAAQKHHKMAIACGFLPRTGDLAERCTDQRLIR